MKERAIVPGSHDHVPPQGRVTVELLDERSQKVVKRVRAENAIMTHWVEATKAMVRGGPSGVLGSYSGYNFHQSEARILSNTDLEWDGSVQWWDKGLQAGGKLWGPWQLFMDSMRSVILTDSTESVNVDEFALPGTVNAFCYMPEAYAPSTNTKRTQLVTATSYRTPSAIRYVSEWGTGYGNGVHNSVAIGACVFPAATAQAYPMPSLYPGKTQTAMSGTPSLAAQASWAHHDNASGGSVQHWLGINQYGASINASRASGHRVSDAEYWVFVSGTASNNLCKLDLTLNTVNPFTQAASGAANGLAVTGPTGTTIGSTTTKTGVTVIGSDLWLAYGGTLKRCVKPTNTTLTVTNTYTPAGIENCVDITTDGTSVIWLGATTVYIINATTGVVSSSWAHGLTGTMHNIAYMAAPVAAPRLHISYEATGLTTDRWNVSGATTVRVPILNALFTVAGAQTGAITLSPESIVSTGIQYCSGGNLFTMSDDCKHSYGWFMGNAASQPSMAGNVVGPTHVSRTVLGATITKTVANSMRVTYEYAF